MSARAVKTISIISAHILLFFCSAASAQALSLSCRLLAAPQNSQLLTDGKFVAEKADWNSEGSIVFAASDSILCTFDAPASISALAIQADWNDVYIFDGLASNQEWIPLWHAPLIEGINRGMRTRSVSFDTPITVSAIRIRAGLSDGTLSVAELVVSQGKEISGLPELTNEWSWSDFWYQERVDAVKPIAIILAIILMLFEGARFRRAKANLLRVLSKLFVIVFALGLWSNFLQFHYRDLLHRHEFYHYYLGSKYSPELSYTNLYLCTLAAEAEKGTLERLGAVSAMDLHDNIIKPADYFLRRSEECISKFTAVRWESFKTDLTWFENHLSPDELKKALLDHGYNATPVWNTVGYLLSNSAPVSDLQLRLLGSLDIVLLLCSFMLIGKFFDLTTAMVVAVYFAANGIATFGWTGGAFLRFDWFVFCILGLIALRIDKFSLSGFLLGYAGLLRIFPFAIPLCVLAALAKGVMKKDRTARKRILLFGSGFIVSICVSVASTFLIIPADNWRDFAHNTKKHLFTRSLNTIGIPSLVSFSWRERSIVTQDPSSPDLFGYWNKEQLLRSERMKPLRIILSIFLAGFVFMLLKPEDLVMSGVLGLGLCLLINLSNYDYIFLAIFGLLNSSLPEAGIALLLLGLATWQPMMLFHVMDEQYFVEGLLSAAFILAVFYIAWKSRNIPIG